VVWGSKNILERSEKTGIVGYDFAYAALRVALFLVYCLYARLYPMGIIIHGRAKCIVVYVKTFYHLAF
jgi:hypothetical protein